MALSYNLGYQESISVHPTRRQNFAGKPYSNFPNIWEWLILWLGMVGIDGRGGFYRCQLARLCAHALNQGQIVQFDHSHHHQHLNQYRDDHHNDHKQSSSPSTSFSLCAHFCWEHLPPSEYWVPSGCTRLTFNCNLFFIFSEEEDTNLGVNLQQISPRWLTNASVQCSQNQAIFQE